MFRKLREDAYFKGIVISVLVFIAMMALVGLANADGGVETQSIASLPTDAVKALLNQVVFPIFSGLVLSLLSILIHRVSSKYKLDILTANQDLIERAALQGISLAEEKAAQYVSSKFKGDEKLSVAIGHMQSVIPTITYPQARNIIEGMLARIPGIGATKDKVVTVQGLPPA